jgi:hypothetical protein
MKPPTVPMIVVICCGCCFLQSTIAFVILLPNIYIRRCYISINFAIMQYCLSITAMMSFIILGLLKFLPQVSDAKYHFPCLFKIIRTRVPKIIEWMNWIWNRLTNFESEFHEFYRELEISNILRFIVFALNSSYKLFETQLLWQHFKADKLHRMQQKIT